MRFGQMSMFGLRTWIGFHDTWPFLEIFIFIVASLTLTIARTEVIEILLRVFGHPVGVGHGESHAIVWAGYFVGGLLYQIGEPHFVHRHHAQCIDEFIFGRIADAGQCNEPCGQLELAIVAGRISIAETKN